MQGQGFQVRFWGVRGTVSCPGPSTLRYGGNTSCIEVRCDDARLIFDAGTGIRMLGNDVLATGGCFRAHLFFTHTHIDHISGLPFFKPAYCSSNALEFWAGHLGQHGLTLQAVLQQLMQAPLFPVPLDIMHACVMFHDFPAGATLQPYPDVVVRTVPLNHPGGATGYRVDFAGRSCSILTDLEHRSDDPDPELVEFLRGCDVVIYDSMYTDEEYECNRGWGHSTWRHGAKLCDAAGARQLIAFHHDPDHDDAQLDHMADEMHRTRPGSLVAREGLTLRL